MNYSFLRLLVFRPHACNYSAMLENLSYRIPFPFRVPGTLFSIPERDSVFVFFAPARRSGNTLLLAKFNSGHRDPNPRDAARGTIYNDIEPTRIFRYSYSGRKVSAIIRVINEGTTAFSDIIAPSERSIKVQRVFRIRK